MATLRIYIYKNTDKYLLGKWITLVGVPTHDVGGSNLGKEEDKREWRSDLEGGFLGEFFVGVWMSVGWWEKDSQSCLRPKILKP